MRMKTESSGRIQTVAVRESAARKEEIRSTHPQATNLTENLIASWRLTLKLSIYQKREASKMDKANTGEQPARLYRNKETGELFTYREMLEEWRERYEGIDPVTGLYQYHWHTRYEYIPK